MSYHKHSAFVEYKLLLQPLDYIIIHMVCRLVKYKQVGVLNHYCGKRHTLSLTARKVCHFFVVVFHSRLVEHRPAHIFRNIRACICHSLFNYRKLRIVLGILREISCFKLVVACNRTALSLDFSCYNFKERRFAAPVNSYKSCFVVFVYTYINIAKKRFFCIALCDMLTCK